MMILRRISKQMRALRKWGVVMKKFYRKHFLGCELVLSIVLVLAGMYVIFNFIGISFIENGLDGIRTNLYGTLASIAGAFLGFVITGLSVLLMSNSTKNIEKLKRSRHYKTIFYIFFSASKYLGVLLLVSLISLIFDKDSNPSILLFFISVWALLIVAIRILRCIWVLEKMVELQTNKS